jgi:hypothetical protein
MSTTAKNINTGTRDGQTQSQRMPFMLNPANAPADSRDMKAMLEYVFKISKELKYFDHTNPQKPEPGTNEGNWQEILNYNETDFTALWNRMQLLKQNQSVPPHISLLFAFLELYQEPHRLLNTLTGRHLDFYYNEVLGLKKNEPVPDKAHLVFELKKNIPPVLLKKDITKATAGKDGMKKELLYKLTHDIIVNNSKVEQMKSLLVNAAGNNELLIAPVANSSDGLGAELDADNPSWNAFGHSGLLKTNVGFCFADDILLMKEGERKITANLKLSGKIESKEDIKPNETFTGLLLVSLTGEKGWTDERIADLKIISVSDTNTQVQFEILLSAGMPAVVVYDPALHGPGYETTKPVMRVLLNNEHEKRYHDFKNLSLVSASISVKVKGSATGK